MGGLFYWHSWTKKRDYPSAHPDEKAALP
jgi:hypothetical protein